MLLRTCILPFCLGYAQSTVNDEKVNIDGLDNDDHGQAGNQDGGTGGESYNQGAHGSGFGQQQQQQQQTIAMSPVFWTVIAVFGMWWVAPLMQKREEEDPTIADGNAIKLGGSRSNDARKGIAASSGKVSAKPSHSDVVRVGMDLPDFADVFEDSVSETESALNQVRDLVVKGPSPGALEELKKVLHRVENVILHLGSPSHLAEFCKCTKHEAGQFPVEICLAAAGFKWSDETDFELDVDSANNRVRVLVVACMVHSFLDRVHDIGAKRWADPELLQVLCPTPGDLYRSRKKFPSYATWKDVPGAKLLPEPNPDMSQAERRLEMEFKLAFINQICPKDAQSNGSKQSCVVHLGLSELARSMCLKHRLSRLQSDTYTMYSRYESAGVINTAEMNSFVMGHIDVLALPPIGDLQLFYFASQLPARADENDFTQLSRDAAAIWQQHFESKDGMVSLYGVSVALESVDAMVFACGITYSMPDGLDSSRNMQKRKVHLPSNAKVAGPKLPSKRSGIQLKMFRDL